MNRIHLNDDFTENILVTARKLEQFLAVYELAFKPDYNDRFWMRHTSELTEYARWT